MLKLKKKKNHISGNPNNLLLGYGLKAEEWEESPIIFDGSYRSGHFWCFGSTRVGKTRLMENMIEQDIRKGNNIVMVDPKGDIELFSKIVQVALEEQRHEDLMLITPIYPEYSISFNPLQYYYMPEELVGHIVSGVDVGKEKFFFNVAYEVSLAIVQSFIFFLKFTKGKTFTFKDVKDVMSHMDLQRLEQELKSIDNPEAQKLTADLRKIIESGQDYYNKISSSLRVALTELTSGNIGKIIGEAHGNKIIERLESGKKIILVAHTGSLITRKASSTMAKVILSMFQAWVGRIFASGRKANPPLAIYVDEAQNVLYFGIEDLFAKAGGAGVWLNGFSQSVNQLYAILGKDTGKSIMDNVNTKLFMRVTDIETAEYAANHFGTKIGYSPIFGVGTNLSIRETDETWVKPENIMELQPRKFYMMSYTGKYFGCTANTSPLYINIKFPAISAIDTEN
jgi:hypothetical protein